MTVIYFTSVLAILLCIFTLLYKFQFLKEFLETIRIVCEHLIFYRFRWYILSWKLKTSWSLPIIGHYWTFIRCGNPMKYFNEYIWPYYNSPTVQWNGPILNLLVGDSETAHAILHSTSFLQKNMIYNLVSKIIGDNLVTLDYNIWKVHRKLLDPAVNSFKNMQGFLPHINTAADNLVSELDKLAGESEVEIHENILYIISNGTVQNIFGTPFDFYNNPEHKDIFHSIIQIQKLAMLRGWKIWLFPDTFYRWSQNSKDVDKINAKFNRILYGLLDSYEKGTSTTILDSCMKLYEKNLLNRTEVRDELAIFFAASTETTASLVYYVLMCLAIHPHYQEKVFKELLEVYPNINDNISKDDYSSLVYLDMVINETMRILPPIPMIGRQATANFKLNDNITIPKGVQVVIDIYKIQRNEKDWGPKANHFDPENFSKENIAKRHPSAFLPFSKGSRNCIGTKYAKMSIRVTLVKILRKFEFMTSTKLEDIVIEEDIVGRLAHYPKIQIIKRLF